MKAALLVYKTKIFEKKLNSTYKLKDMHFKNIRIVMQVKN